MQEEKENMVDIDTSGPGADVELPEEKLENEIETKEDSSSAPQESTDKTVEASDEKPEAKEQKEELQDYSKDVQRRIAKLTKKWREAERQREEALTYAKSVISEKESLQKKYSFVEQAGVKDREARIKSGLEAAQTKLSRSRESGNFADEVEAQKEIARLGYEEARLEEARALQAALPKEEPKIATNLQQREQTSAPDPRAEEWAVRNKWFGTDTAMTYTAFDLHKKLVDDEGYDPQSEEYYAEIDKRIRLDFPHKFGTTSTKVENNTTKPTQIVASAKRSVNTGRKTVRLTPSQVAIAKKLGVPLEEYAKQLKITEGV
jgi:hypothetical protein